MKILWTVSNWKRTGPLEPSLDLAAAMARRGHDVRTALGRTPAGLHDETEAVLGARGLPRVLPEARLAKHAFFWRDVPDVRRLERFLAAERPDVAVTTLANDHRLLVRAAARAGGPPVVRLWFGDGSAVIHRRERRALLATDRVVCFGEAAAARLHDLGVAASRVVVTGPPLDVAGLRRLAEGASGARERFAVPPGAFLFGRW